ncbi:MAG: sel1 repeat family protein [Deltaproteobacteria bacterium]|nr:sel1 repeat family protein [Deltaproteobacteria bacterium]
MAKKKNQPTVEDLTLKASKGDSKAQFSLGRMYYYGAGVRHNLSEARKWLKQAAGLGHAAARKLLNEIDGIGNNPLPREREIVPTLDHPKYERPKGYRDLKLYDLNDQPGVFEFLKTWQKLRPTLQDLEKNPGFEYLRVKGRPANSKELIDNLAQALELGLDVAGLALGDAYGEGLLVKKNLKKAADYFEMAAGIGNSEIQRLAGNIFLLGDEVEKDVEKSISWFIKAAKRGNLNAQNDLGVLYVKGDGQPKDLAEGVRHLTDAAERGHLEAHFNIGVLYAIGNGLPMDPSKSEFWWTKAAEQGFLNAQHNLGILYFKGDGVKKDVKKAMFWWTEAAKRGFSYSQRNLGTLFAIGGDVPIDLKKSEFWWSVAARQELFEAKQEFEKLYDDEEESESRAISKSLSEWLIARQREGLDTDYSLGAFGAQDEAKVPSLTVTIERVGANHGPGAFVAHDQDKVPSMLVKIDRVGANHNPWEFGAQDEVEDEDEDEDEGEDEGEGEGDDDDNDGVDSVILRYKLDKGNKDPVRMDLDQIKDLSIFQKASLIVKTIFKIIYSPIKWLFSKK